jgi:hypothetical protein
MPSFPILLWRLCFSLGLTLCMLPIFSFEAPAFNENAVDADASLVLHDFTLIDGTGAGPRSHVSIVISGDIIKQIVPAESFQPPSNTRVIKGNGRFLIPGLWDTHVHLSYGNEAMLGVLVANGITTVRDMGGDAAVLDFWRHLIENKKIIGPRIYHAGPAVDGPKPPIPYHLTVKNESEAIHAVRVLKDLQVDFVKIHNAVPRNAYFALARE